MKFNILMTGSRFSTAPCLEGGGCFRIHGWMTVPSGKYFIFFYSAAVFCRVCSIDIGFRVKISFVAGQLLQSERVTLRKIKLCHNLKQILVTLSQE